MQEQAQWFFISAVISVRNHINLGVSLRVLYCAVDAGYGLGRSLGDCRPALPKGRKYQMVKTQTESHVRRPVVWTNRWQIWVFFSFENPQRPVWQIPAIPRWTSKEKKNQICHRFDQTISLLTWHSLCFLTILCFRPLGYAGLQSPRDLPSL